MTEAAHNADNLAIMVAVEQTVRDVFEKRCAGRAMTYEHARELVWLERSLVENISDVIRHIGVLDAAP